MQRIAVSTRNAPLATAMLVLLTSIVGGCGEQKVICPDGYYAKEQFCYPNPTGGGGGGGTTDTAGQPDTAVQDAAVSDGTSSLDTVADTGAPDTAPPDAGAPDTSPPDTAKPDTTPTDTAKPDTGGGGSKNPIGAACTDGFDCISGLECFSWPKGYCTVPGCTIGGQPCPGSAVCWGADAQSQLCIAGCELNTDCRLADGYACKRLTASWGGLDAQLCLPGGKATPGLTCKGPLDCSGESTCVTDIPGGYCARVGCGKGDDCEAGTACVLREGKPLCLKTCAADSECQVGGGLVRKCVTRTDLSKATVKVCLDSDKAAPVGAECLADLDCSSGKCTIVAKGTCQIGGAPCLTDAQCGASGPCDMAKEKEKGVCTQPCGKDQGCPTGSACVSDGDALSGSCAAICQGPGDADTCKIPGTECVFGTPIAPPGGAATQTYACAPRPAGSAGANCTTSDECGSGGFCFTNAGKTAGFCQLPCGIGKPACPFGTLCVNSGLAFCERVCSVDYDCPVQMQCITGAAPPNKTCSKP